MFSLDETILHLRTLPIFAGHVGGVMKFNEAVAQKAEAMKHSPVAFVMPMDDDRVGDAMHYAASCWVRTRFNVIVCIDTSEKRAKGDGVGAVSVKDTVTSQLFSALHDWVPESEKQLPITTARGTSAEQEDFLNTDIDDAANCKPVLYEGNVLLAINNTRMWHAYSFSVEHRQFKDPSSIQNPEIPYGINEIRKLYGGFAPNIGAAHIDDYELMVDNTEL